MKYLRALAAIAFVFASLTIAPTAAHGAGSVRLTLEPTFGLWFGQTNYDFAIVDPTFAPPVKFASRLEFPLDAFLVGGQVSLGNRPGLFPQWQVQLRIQASVKDPTDKMLDFDWAGYVGDPQTLFSYTESDVEMSALLVRLRFAHDVAAGNAGALGFFGAIEYQNIKQDIIGYSGWALDTNGAQVPVAGSEPAIDYQIKYILPQAGMFVRKSLGSALTLEAEGGFVGVYVDDRDDHLLRKKVAEADGFGYGGTGRVAVKFQPSTQGSRRLPWVTVGLDLLTLKADPDQSQYWYGDDPASPGFDDTGTRIGGLKHEITSTQYRVEFRLGFPL